MARGLKVLYTHTQTTTTMFSQMKRYLKLKQAATRLMVAGDVQRYLHALRLMHDLRAHHGGQARTGAVA